MRNVAMQAYEKAQVGKSSLMRPDPAKGESLEGFQAVVQAAHTMQENGLILVQELHRESQSGKKLVDAIRFMRMK